MVSGQFPGQGRSALEAPLEKDKRCVGVQNISLGPDGVVGLVGFVEQISIGNRAVFAESATRAPTAMVDSRADSRVERRLVDACLAAGDDFFRSIAYELQFRSRTAFSFGPISSVYWTLSIYRMKS